MASLGCALGGLSWTDVAPIMCKYLHGTDIPIEIYLPREYLIQPEHLKESHLLSQLMAAKYVPMPIAALLHLHITFARFIKIRRGLVNPLSETVRSA